MNRFGIALRAFFKMMNDSLFFGQVEACMRQEVAQPPLPSVAATKCVVRHDGLAVVAVLQREARLVDFLKEPMDAYSDAQVGAAVRQLHRDAGAALERMFGLVPVESHDEGETVTVEPGYDPAGIRLTGNVAGAPPYRGRLCHAGWKATRCEVPEWTGGGESAMVVAPAEVQLD